MPRAVLALLTAPRLAGSLLAGLLLLLAGLPLAAAADTDAVTPAEALSLARSRAAVLVDVRTPVEWNDTGIPPDAATVSWGLPDFGDRVLKLVKGDRDAPLVLICRTGNRSAKAMTYLRDHGFTRVRHVAEGMAGGGAGPGWIARALPTVDWQGN